MEQLLLWDNRPAFPRPVVAENSRPPFPCPGCGAKAGAWVRAIRDDEWVDGLVAALDDPIIRAELTAEYNLCWGGAYCECPEHIRGQEADLTATDIEEEAHFLVLCDECADCPEVALDLLFQNRPEYLEGSEFGAGADEKIDLMAFRQQAGFSSFCGADKPTAVWKPKPLGPPEQCHAEGETGVERCGERWRVRPSYRGRKWFWGIYDTEEEAISRAREFWAIFGGPAKPRPPAWLPCSDGDLGAIAIENENLEWFRREFDASPKLCKRILNQYKTELKRKRAKPTGAEVLCELTARIQAAAGPSVFNLPLEEGEEYATRNGDRNGRK